MLWVQAEFSAQLMAELLQLLTEHSEQLSVSLPAAAMLVLMARAYSAHRELAERLREELLIRTATALRVASEEEAPQMAALQ
jgi:hypothetical protein